MHAVYQKLGEQSHFKQIQTSMRLSTLQLTTGPTHCCQYAIDILAGSLSKVKRFWLCIFRLRQKSPRNLLSQPSRHSTQNLPESIPGSVRGTARECHADVGHGEHHSTLCLSLLLKGPPKRDRSPQTMATQSLLADGPGLLLRVSGPIYCFPECFPFKTGLCSLYLLVETVQF